MSLRRLTTPERPQRNKWNSSKLPPDIEIQVHLEGHCPGSIHRSIAEYKGDDDQAAHRCVSLSVDDRKSP
ncbi:hypothetical protein UA08_00824 [Talaromyces atroroseus]|uniref:Uncharacterized protein n=1 Tax=Talaromyces atroroseus TaxID=1441469 RepID=A0A225AQ14_TALAT|nr:hypothetical protein UA08_00824 [Talaromyces atroroseus]OKL63722.1 hypothetical protein UA08_00824 [Talaromyces atroroseus]